MHGIYSLAHAHTHTHAHTPHHHTLPPPLRAQITADPSSLGPPDVANTLWAVAQMRVRPPLPTLACLMDAAYTHFEGMTAEGLSGLVWALAELRVRPAAGWAQRYLRVVYKR